MTNIIEHITEQAQANRYSQREFSLLTKLGRQKLQGMAKKGILVPCKDGNAKNATCYYTETHLQNLSEALRAYDELKKTNSKKTPVDNSNSLFGEVPADANADVKNSCYREESSKETAADDGAIAPKNFLPMSITPNFDAIPPTMKSLKRWLCWRLIPADPKPKKVPMTLKNGRLINADVTNPDNWLTFDEALNWYKRGQCSGIGFTLTKDPPKVCCVDVDQCITADDKLTNEAQAVIALCGDCFVEKSQSGTGIHIWFIDTEFLSERGRKKDPVEVYAFDRYIAVTGVCIVGSNDLKTANGACNAVIADFIDKGAVNLFNTQPARTPEINFKAVDSTLSDDDLRLIEYFRSDKCKAKDRNVYDLFSGDFESYFKNNPGIVDKTQSIADCRLMCKILFYVGGSGTDAQIAQRALKIFNQSGLARRDKWQREDYQQSTLHEAFTRWVQRGREAIKSSRTHDDDRADDDALNEELRKVNKAIDDFNTKKISALETLKNLQTFDRKTVLSDDVKTAAAFACAFNQSAFVDLKNEIQRYGKIHADVKLNLPDLNAAIKDLVTELKTQLADLLTRRNTLQAQIKSRSFVTGEDLLNGLTIPADYSLTKEIGIEKVEGEGMITICRRPVIIKSKTYNVDEKIYKLVLAYLAQGGSWQLLPPTNAAIVYDAKRLVALADNGLPVTSSNAKGLVEYFDAFHAVNEINLPTTYQVPRCGWYTFSGKDFFVDPRRNCVIQNEGKNISVVVDEKSAFAQHLRAVGELEKWKCAYNLAKQSPIARLVTAAAVAPILLKILNERNFVLYLYSRSRGGKTTVLMLAASTIGDEKILRSFDSTKNALIGAAADVSDYAFLVDEKQSADNRLKENLAEMVYGLGNGIGRSRLNRNGTVQQQKDWRTIAIMTGETPLLANNTVEGADTRCIQIHAPNVILPPDVCRQIRSIIKDNFGLVKPLVIEEVLTANREDLRENFDSIVKGFEQKYPDVLDDYRRYIALLAIADAVLNKVQGVDEEAAMEDAVKVFSANIMPLIPTTFEINATDRERDFVLDFIANNQNHFIGGNVDLERIQSVYGKLHCDDGFTYVLTCALKDACQKAGIDYQKLVSDLVDDGFFKPDDKIPPKQKKPNDTVTIRLGKTLARCLRIPRDRLDDNTVVD